MKFWKEGQQFCCTNVDYVKFYTGSRGFFSSTVHYCGSKKLPQLCYSLRKKGNKEKRTKLQINNYSQAKFIKVERLQGRRVIANLVSEFFILYFYNNY